MITLRWRIAIFAKCLLLIGLGAFLAVLAWLEFREGGALQLFIGFWLGAGALFLLWASSMGLRDVLHGEAVTESGVVALRKRRSGYSLRTAEGRFLEFVLWNPWERLEAGAKYRVTYGRHSGIVVEPPIREDV